MTFGQESEYYSPYFQFKKGTIKQSYGDNVKLREAANLTSKTISLLKINDSVKILGVTEDTLSFDGYL